MLLKQEKLSHKLITKGAWMYILTFLLVPSGYVIRVALSRTLSIEEVGIIYSLLGLFLLIGTYNDIGLTQSLQYFLPKYWLKKKYDHIVTALFGTRSVQIIISLIVIIFLYSGGALWLANNHFHNPAMIETIKWFSWYFLAIETINVLSALFMSFQKVIHHKILDLVKLWVTAGCVIMFISIGRTSVDTMLLGWLIGGIISAVIGLCIFFKNYLPLFKVGNIARPKDEIKKYTKYALWVFLAGNATMLLSQIDQQMIINIIGATDAGYYTNYLSIFGGINSIMLIPAAALLLPIATELSTRGDKKSIIKLYNIMFNYRWIAGWIVGIFLLIYGPMISGLLYGSKFIPSGNLLRYSAWFIPLFARSQIISSILVGTGQIKKYGIIVIVASICNVLINLFLIPLWGIIGAIIATIVSQVLIVCAGMYIIQKSIPIKINMLFISKNMFIISIIGYLIYIRFSSYERLYIHRSYKLLILGISFIVLVLGFLSPNYKVVRTIIQEVRSIRKNI